MNIIEILSKNKNSKIRRESWRNKTLFIKLDRDLGLFYYHGEYLDEYLEEKRFSFSFNDIKTNDWEEYKEPRKYLNYEEMFIALLDGKKIYRENYDGYFFLKEGCVFSSLFETKYFPVLYNDSLEEKMYLKED